MKTEAEKIVIGYCNDIVKKKIPSCSYVKKAVKRFIRDLKTGQEWEYFMDWDKVQQFYDFSKLIKLPDKDEFISLLPWQLFIFANLLGFVYKNNPDKRRFRQGAVYVPRKNEKTTGLLFPLMLYDFLTTESAESYFFEKDEKQGTKIFNELKHIISQNELLRDSVNTTIDTIRMGNSRIAFFTSESAGIDAYRPSVAVIDEYWCFPENKPLTAMRFGGRSRLNNLVLIITTAGTDISLPAYEEQLKVEKLLNDILLDDTYFGIIYGIDQNDDPMTSAAYGKANPSIDFIIDRKILEQDLQDAIATPSHKPDYMAKTLNIWTVGTTSWIPLEKWGQEDGAVDWSEFEGLSCWGSFDLSSINDFTAYTLCFHREDKYYLKHRFYIPSENVIEKYRKDNIAILEWIENGLITAIPGEVIDYSVIFEDIKKDIKTYNIREFVYDTWNSFTLIRMIEDEFSNLVVAAYPQDLKHLSGPTKEYEKLVYEKRIVDPSPVMKWMITNVAIKVDPNGNYKPLKDFKSSTRRIDGVITSIISLNRCIINSNETVNLAFNDILALF
jgi:phage terminase large subunit-like protein